MGFDRFISDICDCWWNTRHQWNQALHKQDNRIQAFSSCYNRKVRIFQIFQTFKTLYKSCAYKLCTVQRWKNSAHLSSMSDQIFFSLICVSGFLINLDESDESCFGWRLMRVSLSSLLHSWLLKKMEKIKYLSDVQWAHLTTRFQP